MKETPFSTVLTALTNTDQSFPSRLLKRFSDLGEKEIAEFMKTWPQVPLIRKRTLMKNLYELFIDDTLMSFEGIATRLMKDDDGEVRHWAVKMLEDTTDTTLIPELVRLAESDPNPAVCATVGTVLGQFVRLAEMGEIGDQSKKLIEETLLKMARAEDPAIARTALESLGYSSRPEVDALILQAFNRVDPLWQATALFAAGRSADNRWQEQVLTGMLSEEDDVRLVAVQSAGELELKVARKPLLDMLEEEPNDDIFQAIIWSLSQIGGEDVRTYLQAVLAEAEDDEQVEYLEEALANLAFTEDLKNFDMMAVDPDLDLDLDEDDE